MSPTARSADLLFSGNAIEAKNTDVHENNALHNGCGDPQDTKIHKMLQNIQKSQKKIQKFWIHVAMHNSSWLVMQLYCVSYHWEYCVLLTLYIKRRYRGVVSVWW